MEHQNLTLEFKCPCCNAPLIFGSKCQHMKCDYCDNTFDLDTVRAYADSMTESDDSAVQWENSAAQQWNDDEQDHLRWFQCDACGGKLTTDATTAATFCPFCGNPAILPVRLSGSVKPDGVIPFKTCKEDAKSAFLRLCKGKPLLPKLFTQEYQVDKITGIYVPFWLYACSAELNGNYKATRIHTWSDSRYIYTKTDHYLLKRLATAAFSGIPMDGSSKMDDTFMESIEPFDYNELVDFEMAYLSGFLADTYDVESSAGEGRIRQRVETSMNDQIGTSFLGYSSVIPTSRQLRIEHGKAKYVLLPVWLLNTRYKDKIYTFAMNGQTGKMTGEFPVCPQRTAGWFFGLWAASAAVISLVQLLL